MVVVVGPDHSTTGEEEQVVDHSAAGVVDSNIKGEKNAQQQMLSATDATGQAISVLTVLQGAVHLMHPRPTSTQPSWTQ